MTKSPKKLKKSKSVAKAGRTQAIAGARVPREIIFAPWRLSYIKRAVKDEKSQGCVFCEAVRKGVGLDSLIVYKGKYCSVILNKFPYNNGHSMVIPHEHTADFGSLQSEAFNEMHELLQRTARVLTAAYQPQGLNIGMNLGRTGGAGIVDHLHYHLVPRWGGDTNFMPVIGGTKIISESLEQTHARIRKFFEAE